MTQDILVDNSVAKNFCNPLDDHYKAFIRWLFNHGVLVVTQRLLVEYHGSTASSPSGSNVVAIVNRLTRAGRISRFTKHQLDSFRFRSHVKRRLRSNRKDHDNIKAVILSVRKYALSLDNNFRHDVNHFPGHSARAECRPQDIPYT